MNNQTVKSEENYNLFDWWKKAYIDNYANFKGRARRKEYWFTTLANLIIILPIYFLLMFSVFSNPESFNNGDVPVTFWIGYGLIILYSLVTFIPNLALIARRFHDVGKSAWHYLIAFIPFVGIIYIIIQFVTDSQNGENQWGDNPKGIGNQNSLNKIGVQEE